MTKRTIPVGDDPAILHEPTCEHCGYRVPNDCVVGAGCPKCHARLLPRSFVAETSRGGERIYALEALVAKQADEIESLRVRLDSLPATSSSSSPLTTAKSDNSPSAAAEKSEGGNDGES